MKILLVTLLVLQSFSGTTAAKFELRMPNVTPQTDDIVLCYAVAVPSEKYIVAFEPKANMSINHHMIVYGCGDMEDGVEYDESSYGNVWNCGEMSGGQDDINYEKGPICMDGQPPSIVYAWAMGAPSFTLPDGVSYQAGTSKIRYLVLQQHYKDTTMFKPPNNAADNGGVIMTISDKPTRRLAGIYLLATSTGILEPKTTTNMEIACLMSNPTNLKMHPFAYRVHAHGNGVVSSGYRVRNGQWTEIGRQSPQLAQTFYNVTTEGINVEQGDVLAARCNMKNDGDTPIEIGSTQHDEMCNFYIYYYTEQEDGRPMEDFCLYPGYPDGNWESFKDADLNLRAIPSNINEVPPPPPGAMMMNHHSMNHQQSSHGGSMMMTHDDGDHDDSMSMMNHKIEGERNFKIPDHHVMSEPMIDDPQYKVNDYQIVDDYPTSNERTAYEYDPDPYGHNSYDDQQQQQNQVQNWGLLAAFGKK